VTAGAYWNVIHAGGIDRARLEGFARAVTLEPEDFPHCRDHLIRDFEDYLGVLKSVHAGTDLGVAAKVCHPPPP
jgi:alpha-glucan,water dikinase